MPCALYQIIELKKDSWQWKKHQELVITAATLAVGILFLFIAEPSFFLCTILSVVLIRLAYSVLRQLGYEQNSLYSGLTCNILFLVIKIAAMYLHMHVFGFCFNLYALLLVCSFALEEIIKEDNFRDGTEILKGILVNKEPLESKEIIVLIFGLEIVALLFLSLNTIELLIALGSWVLSNAVIRHGHFENRSNIKFFVNSQLIISVMIIVLYTWYESVWMATVVIPMLTTILQFLEDKAAYKERIVFLIFVIILFALQPVSQFFSNWSYLSMAILLLTMISENSIISYCGVAMSTVIIFQPVHRELTIVGLACVLIQLFIMQERAQLQMFFNFVSSQLSKLSKLSFSLATSHGIILECVICCNTVNRPLISSCCNRIVGCKDCVETWMRHSRRPVCPHCNSRASLRDFREIKGLQD